MPGADDRHAVVIMPPAEPDSDTWRREYADTLLETLTAHDHELPVTARGNHQWERVAVGQLAV